MGDALALLVMNMRGFGPEDFARLHPAEGTAGLLGGTQSGASAATAVEQLMEQTTQNIRAARGASLRAAQALAESYAALASGVLIGMSEAMQRAATASKPAAPAPAARSKK